MNTIDFLELANEFTLIETTSEANGYPRNLRKAIIGFESYEEAEKHAEKHGLSIEMFERRDGWDLWTRRDRIFKPFDMASIYTEEGYDFYKNISFEEFCEREDVHGQLKECANFDEMSAWLENFKELFEEIETLKEGEILIKDNYGNTFVSKEYTMQYSYDTHNYAIGLIDYNED